MCGIHEEETSLLRESFVTISSGFCTTTLHTSTPSPLRFLPFRLLLIRGHSTSQTIYPHDSPNHHHHSSSTPSPINHPTHSTSSLLQLKTPHTNIRQNQTKPNQTKPIPEKERKNGRTCQQTLRNPRLPLRPHTPSRALGRQLPRHRHPAQRRPRRGALVRRHGHIVEKRKERRGEFVREREGEFGWGQGCEGRHSRGFSCECSIRSGHVLRTRQIGRRLLLIFGLASSSVHRKPTIRLPSFRSMDSRVLRVGNIWASRRRNRRRCRVRVGILPSNWILGSRMGLSMRKRGKRGPIRLD